MSVKFSVGVSETEEDDEDRELLETLRRSPSRIDRTTTDEGLETRPAGWPLRADGEDDPEPQPSSWAW